MIDEVHYKRATALLDI